MLNWSGTLSDIRTILIVADSATAAARAEREIGVLGPYRIERIDWASAAGAVADVAVLTAVFADAEGLADAALTDRLGAIVRATDARIAVIFAPAQIDAVAGAMPPTDAILLCDSDPAQRMAGLALAAFGEGEAVRDQSRDARRFQRINEEVARFAEALARLAGTDEPASARPADADAYVAAPGTTFEGRPVEVDPADVRRAIRARRLREDAFDAPGLFEDPAWDILLDLFAAELERRRVSVSSLCIAAAVAPTTALRWISKLVDAGLLDRRPDEFDRRRAFVSLTARASTAMRNYVGMLHRAGLAIA